MVTEWQFVVIGAFLIWCLVGSLCGLIAPAATEALLIFREDGPEGWLPWREVHFGLTAGNRRVLEHPGDAVDFPAHAELLETVLAQTLHDDTIAIQFAVMRRSAEHVGTRPAVSYLSDRVSLGRVPSL
jgi:hypothetical protein